MSKSNRVVMTIIHLKPLKKDKKKGKPYTYCLSIKEKT
jgi:hypothetical protein